VRPGFLEEPGAQVRSERIVARNSRPSPTCAEQPEIVMAQHRPSLPPDRLAEAIACLRPVEREVLLLRARDRLSHGEIAARLGIAPRKVERILANAIYKLMRSIDRQERRGR
jgi:DNA-directed RNA polymerase specialized sigma24 family protein